METASSYPTCSAGSAGGSSVTAMASTRGAYAGHEDWLREGLVLMAEDELGKGSSPVDTAAFLDTIDPAAPGIMRMYL